MTKRKHFYGVTEKRAVAVASLRAESQGDEMSISGYAASFNVLSSDLGGFREQISPGAFALSLSSGADVKALFNHDPSKLLGRIKARTLKVWEDARGLCFRCMLDKSNTDHTNLHSAIKRGDISECSFGFKVPPDGDVWDEAEENSVRFVRRTLRKVDLLDVSAVTYPAYDSPGATSVAARKAGAVAATKWPPNDRIGDSERKARVESVGRVVAEDMRQMKQSEVSANDDWLSARLSEALSKKGLGWKYLSHDSESGTVIGVPMVVDDDGDENALHSFAGRFNYELDPSGNVILGAYQRYVYEMGPDG